GVRACQIDSSIHGVFKRQLQSNRNLLFDTTFDDPMIYDEITISAKSISGYGDCYEQFEQSYVLGLRRMGRPLCYRCVTPIRRSSNILQLAHQQEEICYNTIGEAKSSCFDATQVTLEDGITVFKVNAEPAVCHIEGRFALEYNLSGADFRCEINSGSEVHNCQSSNVLAVKFRNCSFPDFDMSLKCIGSFQGMNNSQYIIVANEQSDEYRCGLLSTSPDQTISIYFSRDSLCDLLSEHGAFESYRLKPVQSQSVASSCQFPIWLQGEYDTLTVTADWLQYAQGVQGTVPVISKCVQVMDDRVLAYSTTKCGEPLGYHCLWFAPRSESLIEFKTTIPQVNLFPNACGADSEFAQWPWTAAVTANIMPSPCGILGKYTTPPDLRNQECYNVTVDCENRSLMKITAAHCSTDTIFDSRLYQCIASWKDENSLYTYAVKGQETQSCFVTKFSSGQLYMASTGPHCVRNFNFSANAERTIVLEEEVSCDSLQKQKLSRKPAGGVNQLRSSQTVQVDSWLESASVPPIGKSAVDDLQWTSDPTSAAMRTLNFVLLVVIYVWYLI
ncbi:hypothetical protein V3C99_012503, partial [Haemonchus contortus]